MPWALDTTSGVLTHTGTAKEAAMAGSDGPPNMILVLECADRAHEIRVRLLASPDGKSGWELGLKAGDKTRVAIRKVTFGTEAAVSVEALHNVSADGVPFTLECSIQQTTLTARVVTTGGAAAAVSLDIAGDKYLAFKRWGVVSAVNNARVLSVTRCDLVAVTSTRKEVLVAVCGGRLYASLDGTSLAEVPGRVSDADGLVSADQYGGKLYLVGGGLASVFDPVTLTITPWSDAQHPIVKLPGATTGGTTTAVGVRFHRGRALLWTDAGSAIYASAFDDPTDFDVGAVGAGAEKAFVDPVDDAIVAMMTMPNGNLFIGCRASLKMRMGDPLIGAVDTVDILRNVGISGPFAVTSVSESLSVCHTPQGVYVLPLEGLAQDLLRSVLNATVTGGGLNLENRDDYFVSIVRDSQRQQLDLFLTAKATGGVSRGYVYEERTGGYQPGQASVFPHAYPAAGTPTCAILWQGKVVMGTRDGYLTTFDDAAATDHDGSAVTGTMPLELAADNAVSGDTIMAGFRAWTNAAPSTMTLTVWGGATAEAAYAASSRRQLYAGNFQAASAPLLFTVRAPAVVAQLSGAGLWELDAAETDVRYGQTFSRGGWAPAPTPGSPCPAPTTPAAGPTGPGTGPGNSGTGTRPNTDVTVIVTGGSPDSMAIPDWGGLGAD